MINSESGLGKAEEEWDRKGGQRASTWSVIPSFPEASIGQYAKVWISQAVDSQVISIFSVPFECLKYFIILGRDSITAIWRGLAQHGRTQTRNKWDCSLSWLFSPQKYCYEVTVRTSLLEFHSTAKMQPLESFLWIPKRHSEHLWECSYSGHIHQQHKQVWLKIHIFKCTK